MPSTFCMFISQLIVSKLTPSVHYRLLQILSHGYLSVSTQSTTKYQLYKPSKYELQLSIRNLILVLSYYTLYNIYQIKILLPQQYFSLYLCGIIMPHDGSELFGTLVRFISLEWNYYSSLFIRKPLNISAHQFLFNNLNTQCKYD